MAGPIRDLISRMRENRQQRLEDGTALFPAFGSMRERGGNRIGLLRRFRSQEKPAADASPAQPSASETLPAPKNSMTQATGPTVRPASGPSMQATLNPPPVQGGVSDLPDPAALMSEGLQLLRTGTTPQQQRQAQDLMTYATKAMEFAENKRLVADAATRQTFEYNIEQVNNAAALAAKDGNYATYEQALLASNMVPKDNTGKPVGDVPFAKMARPAANNAIFSSLKIGPSNLSPQDMMTLQTNIAYAYPVSFGVSRDGTPVAPTAESAQKAVTLMFNDLNQQFNPKGDKANAAILRGLALEIVHRKARDMGFQGQVLSRQMIPQPSSADRIRSDF
jgi:hypothetical protein